jgi:hypothetical protein
MKSGSNSQLHVDACAIRGILDLLEAGPITTREAAMTQHVSLQTATRLMTALANEGVIEHPITDADILGTTQKVICLSYQLTAAARRGEIPMDAEKPARGMA